MNSLWTEDLSVGVPEIDNQHKELFRRNNAFMEAASQGRGREELMTLVTFLEVYIVSHFSLEEFYMNAYGYPEFQEHRAEHRGFVATVMDLRAKVNGQEGGDELAVVAKRVIVDWLTHHIMVVDRKLGVFLRGKLPANQGPDIFLHGAPATEKHYRGGLQDAEMMLIVDGILEGGRHTVALSSGRQTAWLTVPHQHRGRISLAGSGGSFVVLTDNGKVLDGQEGAPVECTAGTFRIIAGADLQRFTIEVSGA